MSNFPRIVALDTDWTIWQNFLDQSRWGRGNGRSPRAEDNIQRVDRFLLRDKTNRNNWIRVYGDVSRIINDILRNGAQLAIVSRNPSKPMCDRALYYYNAINPRDNKEWSIIHLASFDEVVNESKTRHFRRINTLSKNDYLDMILYDDEGVNNVARVELGVTYQIVKGGLTWDTYQRGLTAWRNAKRTVIPRSPGFIPNRVRIGYCGLPNYWIDLIRKGEGQVDSTKPARWGYALYVADSLAIAKWFRDFDRVNFNEEIHCCEIWVKDYPTWAGINKIWVPEDGTPSQTDNMNWTPERTGQSQEERDAYIERNFGVKAPYVLFSRHYRIDMPGYTFPTPGRWTEMAVYTQIQREFIEVVPLADHQVDNHHDPYPYPFERQVKAWNITVPQVTRNEFRRCGEHDLYSMTA